MADVTQSQLPLSPGAEDIVARAVALRQQFAHSFLCLNHWLCALLERHAEMAADLATGLTEPRHLQRHLLSRLGANETGNPLPDAELFAAASGEAQARGARKVYERDLATAILAAAGYRLKDSFPDLPVSGTSVERDPAHAPTASSGYSPRALRPTPTIEKFGRDLTAAALGGKLSPVVERDEEIQLVIETLCRRTKRNPLLVGPAGVGKTAIVEGLAQRIVEERVPEPLRYVRIMSLQPSSLVAGASYAGELDKRIGMILAEAAQDGIILFIDEVHSIIGTGGREGTSDIASQLKPALARGEISCLAATTDEEYRRFIESDSALERRFQPIRVQELSPAQTLEVLATLRDELGRQRRVVVPDEVLHSLVEFAARHMRNRYFPDKGVDLLEQCVAYAISQGRETVSPADAETIARRLTGMPVAVGERVSSLAARLAARPLLIESDARALCNRLEVTSRGLDLRPSRPNAVLLLMGEAAAKGAALAETIAETLCGGGNRVIAIDFGRFDQPEDLNMLIGSPPGYVGYNDTLPLHRLAQMPWCVIRADNIHACHPQVLAVWQEALAEGVLTDARGRRLYLSDAVVLMTAAIPVAQEMNRKSIGFRQDLSVGEDEDGDHARRIAARALGEELVGECDLVCTAVPQADGTGQRLWLECGPLPQLAARYKKHGIDLHWDESLVGWLSAQQLTERKWEHLVDNELAPLLIDHISTENTRKLTSLLVKYADGRLAVEPQPPTERTD